MGTEVEKAAALAPMNDGERAFALVQREATALSKSQLMPEAYRNNVPNCLIAMEMAKRIGASVLMVAQNLHIIHGKPGWSSTFLIATVNASGKWSPLKFRYEGAAGKPDWSCRAWAKDKETGEECIGPAVTMAMAKAEGWSTKNGSKWATMPELMLSYRAAAFWTRLYAPEIAMGIHTADELQDMRAGNQIRELPEALMPGDTKDLEAALLDAPGETVAVATREREPGDDDGDYLADPSDEAAQ